MRRHSVTALFSSALLCLSLPFGTSSARAVAAPPVRHLVLATNRTSTMEGEMNDAASKGYRFGGAMGGETAFGGSEVVVVMESRSSDQPTEGGDFQYKLLATSKTSTMQKEMQAAGDAGFEYKGQSVFKTAFGGSEVVVILERDRTRKNAPRYEYRLLATKKTSTMQKELSDVGAEGFEFVGLTVAETLGGGNEVVTIMRRATGR